MVTSYNSASSLRTSQRTTFPPKGVHTLWMRTSFLQLRHHWMPLALLLASVSNTTQRVLFILLLSNRGIHSPEGHETLEASTHTRCPKLMKMKRWSWSCRTKSGVQIGTVPGHSQQTHRVPFLSSLQAMPRLLLTGFFFFFSILKTKTQILLLTPRKE